MALDCLSQLLSPFVTILLRCGVRKERQLEPLGCGPADHRPSAGSLGDLGGGVADAPACLQAASAGEAVYSAPEACLLARPPVLAA